MTLPKSTKSLTWIGTRAALSAVLATAPVLVHAENPSLTARVIVQYSATSNLTTPAFQLGASGSAPNNARMRNLSLRTGLSLQSGRHISPNMHVVVAEGLTSAQLSQQLSRQPGVAFAVEDRRVKIAATPNDRFYASVLEEGDTKGPVVGQWYLKAPNSVFNSSINAERAWDLSIGNPSVIVAVLDTGVLANHPDLGANITTVPGDDGKPKLYGYDFITDDVTGGDGERGRDPNFSDMGDWTTETEAAIFPGCEVSPSSSWHGTQVAGLIGAITDNKIGMASVGRTVSILPVRVLGKCGGSDSDVIAGMRWAAGLPVPDVENNQRPAKVLNLSLGSSDTCGPAYESAMSEISNKGVVVVAAAGNSGGRAIGAPANCPGVIAVSAVNHSGTKTSYSDIGPEATISAPGGNCHNPPDKACLFPILSTTNLGKTLPEPYDDPELIYYTDSYETAGIGTSFASPLVAGTAALMLSVNPNLTPTEIKSLLQKTARPFPSLSWDAEEIPQCKTPNPSTGSQFGQDICHCTTSTCGAGMLDAGAAVQMVKTSFQPKIVLSSALPRATEALTLSANSSVVPAGRTIVGYNWTLVDGGGIVNRFTAGADTATASVTPRFPGRFAVRLTMIEDPTDPSKQYSVTQSFEVDAAPPAPPVPDPGSQRSTGGGSMQPWVLLGLLGATLALMAHRGYRRFKKIR